MARWGEGDPRWIVEERPDATNVNNWHWTEKNASDWSKVQLNSLFKKLSMEAPGLGTISITELSKCEGEAMVNNRKGKLIFFYEWAVEMEWVGKSENQKEEDEEIKGKIEITNLSEENEPHEIDINVSLTKSSDIGDSFKEFIRLKGVNHVRDKVQLYIQALRDEYASNLILPTKNQGTSKSSKTIISQDLANNIKNIKVGPPAESTESCGLKFHTTTIASSQNLKCTSEEIYRALTNREMVCAFTRNEVKLSSEPGGKFELFGGNVCGEFVTLEPAKKIVQKWRFKSWPKNHYSEVVITFEQGDDQTRVDVTQTGVPVSDVDRTKQGWQNYYWDSIKRTFGFGAQLN